MEHLYPAGPAEVPAGLANPTPAYRRHAWLAMASLAIFVLLYLALSGWFLWTAYRLIAAVGRGGDQAFWGLLVGVCSGFLAVFMLKALFFVKHGQKSDDIEVTAAQQPRLFEFLNRLADEAGAPRPHRVYLSARVNAAVFYDLSIANLLLPSRKNLEIGLALVNVLSLGELKAVLAHEFGHFAQRSMAVGRWVYIAQQIASHIIAKRDALDGFLRGLSRFDIRIAWIGWLLSLVVWSIRSLMETLFRGVVLAQRALSREMELQADLVAVSLTGSDALIHALYRLQVADEAWDRALNFANGELRRGHLTPDLFAVQTRTIERMSQILDKPDYGRPPPLPAQQQDAHRVFTEQIAQAPRMWSTHPANSERERNAKRIYVAAPCEERSAWELFDGQQRLREQVSAHLVREVKGEPAMPEASLARLDEQFNRSYLDRGYRGVYLGRSVVRSAKLASELYAPTRDAAELASLYPPSLSEDLQQLRSLEEEAAALEALRDGFLTAPGGIISHRGQQLKRKQLPAVIAGVRAEIGLVMERVTDHDRRCRTAHLAAAAGLERGWSEYLKGLAQLLHYADHTEANLRDVQGMMHNVVAIVTADGKVSDNELRRLLSATDQVYTALQAVHGQAPAVRIDTALAERLGYGDWPAALGKFELPPPTRENINDWMRHIDSWINAAAEPLGSLRLAALEQLLVTESLVAAWSRDVATLEDAPAASATPNSYPTLTPGSERPRQKKLDLWDRFQLADGPLPMIARLAVAGGIVGAVLTLGGSVGSSTLTIYNGLGRTVVVEVDGGRHEVPAFDSRRLELTQDQGYEVTTTTTDGEPIESFEGEVSGSFGSYVYNVASAAPLVQWTAVYGNVPERAPVQLGAPRWSTTEADVLFTEPPTKIDSKTGGGFRTVLTGLGDGSPGQVLGLLKREKQHGPVIDAHARWDGSNTPHILTWLGMAAQRGEIDDVLKQRLRNNPRDALNLRVEQDEARRQGKHAEVCQRQRALLAASTVNESYLQYAAARCLDDASARDRAFLEQAARWPQNAWLAMAAGYTLAEEERWQEAVPKLQQAMRTLPPVADYVALDLARIQRVRGDFGNLVELKERSSELQYLLALESGEGIEGAMLGYSALARGELGVAMAHVEKDAEARPRLLFLAAASDGASESLRTQALALPPEQAADPDSAWAALGLAMRQGADTAPYAEILRKFDEEEAQEVLSFLAAARGGMAPQQAEGLLNDLDPEARGHAYAAATVALAGNAPEQWREGAKRLLFAAERPYFR